MENLIFDKKKIDFYELALIARKNKLDHYEILNKAYEQNILLDDNQKILLKFIKSFQNKKNIKSQLYQDIFASFVVNDKFDKSFLEFGATDGSSLSNTYMLEEELKWKGVLSEPSPQWHTSLKLIRQNTKIVTKCIWAETGKKLEFFVSDIGELSTINSFVENEKGSMSGNVDLRKKSGKLILVETISLNDLINENFNDKAPSYISIDTEGSEYEILKTFNFDIYRPKVFTIEHNFTPNQQKIDDLMNKNNYKRIFKELTAFDAWYVSNEVFVDLES